MPNALHPQTRSQRPAAGVAALLLLLVDLGAGLSAGVAQTAKPSKATVREILDRPELFIDRRKAKVKDVAQQPESLKTLQCRAQLAFANGAGGRMIKGSTIRLGECLFISQGSVLVSGPMCACSRSVKVCSKNTNYILEAMEDGDAAVTSLEGTLEVQPLDPDLSASKPATVVNSGQRWRFYQGPGFTTVVDLTPEDYQHIIEGPHFSGFRERLPSQGALKDYLQAHVPGVTLPEPEPDRSSNSSVNPSVNPMLLLPLLIDFAPWPGSRPRPSRPNDYDQPGPRPRPQNSNPGYPRSPNLQ
ncbi:MAG: hypothetical protein ACKO02_03320 [Cyanobium sp.]